MDNFLNRLNRNPYQPIDSASITRVDELGNGYDDWNNLIAPKFEQPQQTWGETALGVATAPARMATALAGSLSPYGADGWQIPPIVHEGVNALTAVGDAYNYGMTDDEINSRALGMAGFMMGGGGLAARPASRAANLFPDQPRAMSADLFAEAVPAGERFGAKTAAAADPRKSKHWPSWGDREPDRAAAHVREQEAADAWFSIVDPIMYDERGLKRMERHEAEALAIERFPDALDKGFAYKEAAKAWNEIDKGRPMTAAEQAWFDLDLAPGRARTSRDEIMRDIVMPNMIMPDGSTGVQHMAAANGPKKLYSNASKESSIPAIASALDMSTEARLARMGESGFEPGWLHGSWDTGISEIDPSKFGSRFGRESDSGGFITTTNPEVANYYAQFRHGRGFDESLPFRGDDVQGAVYPLATRAENPLLADASFIAEKFPQWADDAKYSGDGGQVFLWDLAGKDLADFARANGNDAVILNAADGKLQLSINPRNIRSVNAAFDPAKADSANILAANSDSRPALLASALDMSTEARLARAREMGFDTDRTLYHGTDRDFESFNPSQSGAYGPGVYVTPDADYANRYAVGRSGWEQDTRIMPLHVRGEMADGMLYESLKREARTSGVPDDQIAMAVQQQLQDMGYAGVEGRANQAVAVFDPSNIRSVNAAFDPAMADSANILAANADSKPALLASALGQDDIPDWLLPYLPPQ